MSPDVVAYYRSALSCLRFIEERRPTKRRFGAEAQALWGEFHGDLTDTDRMDVVLRDADVQWPGAFGARTVFGLAGVAEDDAFGAEWSGLDAVEGAALWREVESGATSSDAVGVLTAVAKAWHVSLAPVDAPRVGPSELLVIAGPSAVAALVRVFLADADLDWAEQVTCIATPPAHRQIAALAGALLNVSKRVRVLGAKDAFEQRKRARLVSSPDAAPEDAARAAEVTGK